MKLHILILSLSVIFSACSPYYCSKSFSTPCGTLEQQAENLVKRLLDHPEDWICILENEKCVDCSYYLNSIKKNKILAYSKHKSLITFHDEECTIRRIYRLTLSEMYPKTEFSEKTYGLCVEIGDCRSEDYDPGVNPHVLILNVYFIITDKELLQIYKIERD